jgi:hypothetical protein
MRKPHRTLLLTVIALTISGIFFTSSASADKPTTQTAAPLATFLIASNMNHKCLEVRDGNTGNGVLVDMWDCAGPNEHWYWIGDQIRSDLSGRCLDVAGSNGDNGAAVNMFNCLGTNQQRWYWDGLKLRNKINGKCLSIANSNWWNGAAVVMWDCVGTANQNWYQAG